MQTYSVRIEPVSPGNFDNFRNLDPGDGSYATTPAGLRTIVLPMTQAQVVGVQGYLTLIAGGAATGAIETAITGVGPT